MCTIVCTRMLHVACDCMHVYDCMYVYDCMHVYDCMYVYDTDACVRLYFAACVRLYVRADCMSMRVHMHVY